MIRDRTAHHLTIRRHVPKRCFADFHGDIIVGDLLPGGDVTQCVERPNGEDFVVGRAHHRARIYLRRLIGGDEELLVGNASRAVETAQHLQREGFDLLVVGHAHLHVVLVIGDVVDDAGAIAFASFVRQALSVPVADLRAEKHAKHNDHQIDANGEPVVLADVLADTS